MDKTALQRAKMAERHFQDAIKQSSPETRAMLNNFVEWFFEHERQFEDLNLLSEYLTASDFAHLIMFSNLEHEYIESVKSTLKDKVITLPKHKSKGNQNE